jgi:hypothetical protein
MKVISLNEFIATLATLVVSPGFSQTDLEFLVTQVVAV